MKMNLVLFFFLTAPFTTSVHAKISCQLQFSLYNSRTDQPQFSYAFPANGVLQSSDRAQIEKILKAKQSKNKINAPRLPWSVVSDILLQARMRSLPIQDRLVVYFNTNNFSAQYSGDSDFVCNAGKIVLPFSLIDTPIAAILEAHEREHRIQLLAGNPNSSPQLSQLKRARYQFNSFEMYSDEAEAIKAEWEIVSLVSDKEAQRTLQLLEGSSIPIKELLQWTLQNRHLSQAEYLDQQHRRGRYSFLQTTTMVQVNWMKLFFGGFQ